MVAVNPQNSDPFRTSCAVAALAYAKMGIPVFPLHSVDEHGRCSCSKLNCSNPGKHPRTANGLKNATTNEFMVRKWWSQWPNANIGGRTGVQFVVLDPDGGDEALREAASYDVDLAGPHSTTGNGKHFLFKLPDGITLRNKVKETGSWPLHYCDARAEGGYIVLPPSRHYKGRTYTWSAPLDLTTLPDVPAKLLEVWRDAPDDPRNSVMIQDGAPDELEDAEVNDGDARGEVTAQYFVTKYTSHIQANPNAGRNTVGFYLALQLRDNGISREGAVQYMRQYWQAVATLATSKGAYEWGEVESSLEQAYSHPARDPLPRRYEPSDTGNSRRFHDTYGRDYHYNRDMKEWLRWDGVRWSPDALGRVQEDAKAISADIFKEALSLTDDDKAKKLKAWAVMSGNGGHIKSVLTLASTEGYIPVSMRQLDTDQMLLAFPNGYYNLLTDEFTEPRKRSLITKICAAPYDPNARSTEWQWALDKFMPDPAERRDLQVALAYCLTGRAKEHTFLAVGDSKCGKSTIINTALNALNDYALAINVDTFASSHYADGSRAREDLVAMVGRRMVVASESNQGVRLNAALLKRVTGNDPLSMRANYGRQFTALPTFGMWLLANHLPKLPADDNAVWERVHVFRFKHYIRPEERNEALRDRTVDPAVTGSAVLAWLLEGWRILRDELGGRLVLPTTVQETAQYREAEDAVAQFINECCVEAEHVTCRASEFKAAFRRFLQREGVHEQYTDQRLGRVLRARGIESYRSSGTWYRGVDVLDFARVRDYE